ncbi:hypothetical protein [Natrarchaeobaculum sulfurireducens]|uniref:hypothetical protein n=1 Tax=Natrarchaeobaculum sulfurireducens TaxID=2044521 RepID=UPI000E3C65C9|nr:hypothetical protein [Natrarchaeobaculum sulfurireducens]
MQPDGDPAAVQVERGWFRFGVVLALLYATFTLVVFSVLQVDETLGIAVAVGGGVLIGVGVMIYVFVVKGAGDLSIPRG